MDRLIIGIDESENKDHMCMTIAREIGKGYTIINQFHDDKARKIIEELTSYTYKTCTDKQWEHCRVEKMGCDGCHYNLENKNVCRHCGSGEPRYCEKCFQDLISENTLLRMKLNNTHIPRID